MLRRNEERGRERGRIFDYSREERDETLKKRVSITKIDHNFGQGEGEVQKKEESEGFLLVRPGDRRGLHSCGNASRGGKRSQKTFAEEGKRKRC